MSEMRFVYTGAFAKWVRKHHLAKAMEGLLGELILNPTAGSVIPGGHGLRKIRMAGGNRGKRGGFRVIYFIVIAGERIALLDGYAKNEAENITLAELRELAQLAESLRGE